MRFIDSSKISPNNDFSHIFCIQWKFLEWVEWCWNRENYIMQKMSILTKRWISLVTIVHSFFICETVVRWHCSSTVLTKKISSGTVIFGQIGLMIKQTSVWRKECKIFEIISVKFRRCSTVMLMESNKCYLISDTIFNCDRVSSIFENCLGFKIAKPAFGKSHSVIQLWICLVIIGIFWDEPPWGLDYSAWAFPNTIIKIKISISKKCSL